MGIKLQKRKKESRIGRGSSSKKQERRIRNKKGVYLSRKKNSITNPSEHINNTKNDKL